MFEEGGFLTPLPQFTGPARAQVSREMEEELERRRRGRRWAEEQWRRMEEERRSQGFGGFYDSRFHQEHQGHQGPRDHRPPFHQQAANNNFTPSQARQNALIARLTMQVSSILRKSGLTPLKQ